MTPLSTQTDAPETVALLVLVHGSPRPVANGDMFAVIERLRARPDASARFPIVYVGFMECNEPTIPDAIDACVRDGATAIVAVPYFLHTGTHVTGDLPDLLDAAQTRYPEVRFTMGDYIGRAPQMAELLEKRIAELSPEGNPS